MQRRQTLFAFLLVCAGLFWGGASLLAQINSGTISGVVTDPQGLAVRGAKIAVTASATSAERTATADDSGHYSFVGLVPGDYRLRVEGTNFAPYENSAVHVIVGQDTIINVRLELGTQQQTVTVTTEGALIETTRSESAQTVEQRQIDNLPINGRNYINFTLINSQVTRDVAPTIGPAPNSGLDISGARGRSNMVSVDGADAVDNSVNGIRSTVSQEAVQEFQMILSNYNAEYGRATGGVVNIVTKSGTNDFHGNVYGYMRNSALQARNPFSGEINAEGDLVPVKQSYTRVQPGATLGGAIKKDKTFYFFSYEYTQREESGYSSIGIDKFGLTTGSVPCIPAPISLTPSQLGYYQAALGQLTNGGNNCIGNSAPVQTQISGLQEAALVTGASSNVAVKGDMNVNVDGTTVPLTAILFGPQVAALLPNSKFFPAPVACPLSQQVNSVICLPNGSPTVGTGFVPLPPSYVALDSLRGNFPVSEKTSLWSARLDQRWNNQNTSFVRVGVSPSNVTGIQSTSQNQVFGQNAGSRTGANHYRDVNVTAQHDTILNDSIFNEFRFQFARRGLHFGYSPLPGGDQIAVNIPGYAYFGREPYSTVDRIERRWQFTDAVTMTRGKHTIKFGGDYNLIQLRSSQPQIFQLDFGGDTNFGGLALFGNSIPSTTGLQSYGVGIPTTYIQGIGTANQPFNNNVFAFFAQDTWRLTPKLTLNYGLRYDLELTPLFTPATAINAAAEKALGVVEGIPRDYNNVAPRFGLAWDPTGDGRTVVRAGYGIFYDHPLLAIAFDSVTADGARSVQLLSGPGKASACGLVTTVCGGGLDSPGNLNGSSIFQGTLNALPSMYYLPDQQRFNALANNSLFANQNYLAVGFPLPILPFTLPVAKNFQYGYAQQANLTVERALGHNWKVSAGYQWTLGLHLNRPIDINSTDPVLLTNNLLNATAAGLNFASPLTVAVPAQDTLPTPAACGLFVSATQAPGVLGVLNGCPPSLSSFNGKFVSTPAFFNYFRPSGPNPSFASLVPGGYATQMQLAKIAGYPVGFGVPVPFNSVDTQVSDASSNYSALTVNVNKSFSNHFELLSSWTWSHSIDDGTDLQSTLEPADSRFPYLERGNSVNDQRHRWVTSGVFQTNPYTAGLSFWKGFLSNWTLAPLVEVSSGRPFNVITGTDTRLDLGASEIRPQAYGGTISPFIPGVTFGAPQVCLTNSKQPFTVPGITPYQGCTGNLGRDAFTMPFFYEFDTRLAKGINFGERFRLDVMLDVFNLFNHTNIIAVNQLCDPTAGPGCAAGQPSAAADARQFQFALKFSW